MQKQHTPGPWEWDGSVAVRAGQIEDGKTTSNLLALVYSRRIGDAGGLDANARLIAAAPDLLGALKLCIARDNSLKANATVMGAIAKAEGRS